MKSLAALQRMASLAVACIAAALIGCVDATPRVSSGPQAPSNNGGHNMDASTSSTSGQADASVDAGQVACPDPRFTGPNCDECVDTRFMGSNCDQCVDARFIGPNCDVCADFRFTGAMCDQCANPLLMGDECDECIDTRFEGANCDKANASYQSSLGLQWVQSVVNNIYFARTETTVRQFQACVMTGACSRGNYRIQPNPGSSSCSYDRAGSSEHPMSCVNWFGAVEFCTWIGARLPWKNEWIQEATNNGDRRYPWGDSPGPSCTHCIMHQGVINNMPGVGCGLNSTWPVCSKPEGNSVSGLCDMAGNIQEWTKTEDSGRMVYCNSNYGDGASSNFRAEYCRRYEADNSYSSMGFRCARDSLP